MRKLELSYTLDGSSDFFAFSTGRRAISSLHTTITLRPYQDFFQLAYQVIRGIIEITYRAEDEVELDFTFQDSANVPDCVWGIVAKDELKSIKDSRWDLVSTVYSLAIQLALTACRASLGSLNIPACRSHSPSCPVRSLQLNLHLASLTATPLRIR